MNREKALENLGVVVGVATLLLAVVLLAAVLLGGHAYICVWNLSNRPAVAVEDPGVSVLPDTPAATAVAEGVGDAPPPEGGLRHWYWLSIATLAICVLPLAVGPLAGGRGFTRTMAFRETVVWGSIIVVLSSLTADVLVADHLWGLPRWLWICVYIGGVIGVLVLLAALLAYLGAVTGYGLVMGQETKVYTCGKCHAQLSLWRIRPDGSVLSCWHCGRTVVYDSTTDLD